MAALLPVLALNGLADRTGRCLLPGDERTYRERASTSEFDPYATSAEAAYSAGRGLLYLIVDELLVEETC